MCRVLRKLHCGHPRANYEPGTNASYGAATDVGAYFLLVFFCTDAGAFFGGLRLRSGDESGCGEEVPAVASWSWKQGRGVKHGQNDNAAAAKAKEDFEAR